MVTRYKYVVTFLFLISTYIHTIIYVYNPENRALCERPESGFWGVTEIFRDSATILDGFFGVGRYGRMPEERIDWFDSYLNGPKWFSNDKELK